MIDYSYVLSKKYSDKSWSLDGDSYDGLMWFDNSPKPTKDELDAEIVIAKTEYDAKKYHRDRAKAYPSIVDQLDTLYHVGFDAWKATIDAVKNQYPKP
jgi:hypothetical protein